MKSLADLFRYKSWADQRILEACDLIDPVAFPETYAFISQQFNHLVIVEENFKARLLNQSDPHTTSNTLPLPGLHELQKRIRSSNAWYQTYVQETTAEKFSEWVNFRFVDAQRGSMTPLEILFHIINHGTYHRGAIGHALNKSGHARPADSYSLYIHSIEPERRNQIPTLSVNA